MSHPFDSIARVCHEVNRAYCQALGDNSQTAWEDAPEWQKASARMGVDLHMSGDFGPEASHVSWMWQKTEEGWAYGPLKNVDKKEHPCMMPFHALPREQQAKNYIFRAVVHALRPTVSAGVPLANTLNSAHMLPVFMAVDDKSVGGDPINAAIEQEVQRKGLTVLRITPQHIDEQIVRAQYFRFPDTTVTVCCLTLRNGFNVVGESACVSPENFDAEIGRKAAYEDAKQKIWVLEGYLLRDFLHANYGA